jgi:uncharacterized protein DUF4402
MNFRSTLIAANAAIALSALAGGAVAAGSVSATANASVTVVAPITLTKTQDLAFGQVVRPSNTDTNTVTLDTNDTVTVSGLGNGSLLSSTATSARFNISAPAGTTYTTTQVLNFATTGLTGIGASSPAVTTGALGTIPAGGIQELRYGGHFDMNAATPAQAYAGTLSVTVTYD